LRCDANVSVRPRNSEKLGTKVEIKNLNSFRFLQKALDYEIGRQARTLAQGGRIHQETRLWEEERGCTITMRTKEEAHDYRYFPEPDLPPLKLDPAWVEEMKRTLPELPHAKQERFVAEYHVSADDALLLTSTATLAHYFEECARSSGNPRAAANWIMGEVAYALKSSGKEIEDCPVPAGRLSTLIQLVDAGKISGKIAKTVFEEMFRTGEEPSAVLGRLGLAQISDRASLQSVIEKVKASNPKQVADYRAGRDKLFGYFVGQVMKETKGQANPQVVNELLQEALRE